MSINKYKYKVQYRELYPDIEISDEVLNELKKSDRKMEYMEYDLKQEKVIIGENSIQFLPCREDSLERLLENRKDFDDISLNVEQNFIETREFENLRQCLKMLSEREQNLIQAIFFECLTEREYADKIGVTQQNIHSRKNRLLKKLKKLFLKVL